jgi:hypothetical protein
VQRLPCWAPNTFCPLSCKGVHNHIIITRFQFQRCYVEARKRKMNGHHKTNWNGLCSCTL